MQNPPSVCQEVVLWYLQCFKTYPHSSAMAIICFSLFMSSAPFPLCSWLPQLGRQWLMPCPSLIAPIRCTKYYYIAPRLGFRLQHQRICKGGWFHARLIRQRCLYLLVRLFSSFPFLFGVPWSLLGLAFGRYVKFANETRTLISSSTHRPLPSSMPSLDHSVSALAS